MSKKEKKPVGRPRKFRTPQEVQEKINEYFEWAEANNRPLNMERFKCFLGICNDTLTPYMNGTYDDGVAEEDFSDYGNFSETIKAARAYIAADKMELAMTGSYNPTMVIFDLKNNHGYVDKREIESTNTEVPTVKVEFVDPD